MSEQTEMLRRAASLMRENAGQATGAPWVGLANGTVRGVGDNRVADVVPSWNLRHIASWHPAVALAVADWLDRLHDFLTSTEYDRDEELDAALAGESDAYPLSDWPEVESALATAHAYLGSDA